MTLIDGLPTPEQPPQSILTLPAVPKLKGRKPRSSDESAQHFWERVDSTAGDAACWPWTGATSDSGYGVVWADGRPKKAHRIAWRLTYGALGADEKILHHCDCPPCCNPDHLFVGSMADNTADMVRKGRHNRDGKRHLTPEQVVAIREAYAAGGTTYAAIARDYNVTWVAIHLVVKRKTWRDVA